MRNALPDESLDQIFRAARTFNGWTDVPVEEKVIRELYDLLKWGPTSANSSPARFVWVRSTEGKAKLAELASVKNRPTILQAPLTVIIGNDLNFAAALPKLLPHNVEVMQKVFSSPAVSEATAMRNGTLQGAYLIQGLRKRGISYGFVLARRLQQRARETRLRCGGYHRYSIPVYDLAAAVTIKLPYANGIPSVIAEVVSQFEHPVGRIATAF